MGDAHMPHHGPMGHPHRTGHHGQEHEHDFTQNDLVHGHRGDASPIPPSSPGLTTAFHRHPPGHGEDPMSSSMPVLRRRNTPRLDHDMLRIAIATPFSDNEQRKERQVAASTTVSALKDLIAQDEGEKWERNGMRLVWQGRIVRDEEVLSKIVEKSAVAQVHTFHLVARRIGGPTRPVISTTFSPATTSPSTYVPTSITTIPPTPSTAVPTSRNTQALSDTVHFVLFLTRFHLCRLLNTPPLGWYDTVPPPVIDQKAAKEAVMSVVGAIASSRQDREEGWENWQAAFQDEAEVKWGVDTRRAIEDEIKGLWSGQVGRQWNESEAGEQVDIELEQVTLPYRLHVPPLRLMTPSQLVDMVLYLRLTSMLPLLNNVLTVSTANESTPSPTRTTPPVPPLRPVQVRQFGLRLRVTREAIVHIFFSLVKTSAMVWMLTRGMNWGDVKFWIIGGGLVGWWLGDAINQLRPGVIWNNGNRANAADGQQPPANGPPLNPRQDGGIPNQIAADAPRHAAAAAQAAAANTAPTPRFTATTGNALVRMIPLVHLDTDSEQLLLASRRPRRTPYRIVTQLLLPIALWFITLIPDWETSRARAIRRRERAMRVWVGELTSAQGEHDSPHMEREEGGETGAHEGARQERPPVFPPGLGGQAMRYYERVLARGEGIDWEEEREAQRAMGVGEEEEQDDGMRFRLL